MFLDFVNTAAKTAGLVILLIAAASIVHLQASNSNAGNEAVSCILFAGMCAAGYILFKITETIYNYTSAYSEFMYKKAADIKKLCVMYPYELNMLEAA